MEAISGKTGIRAQDRSPERIEPYVGTCRRFIGAGPALVEGSAVLHRHRLIVTMAAAFSGSVPAAGVFMDDDKRGIR